MENTIQIIYNELKKEVIYEEGYYASHKEWNCLRDDLKNSLNEKQLRLFLEVEAFFKYMKMIEDEKSFEMGLKKGGVLAKELENL